MSIVFMSLSWRRIFLIVAFGLHICTTSYSAATRMMPRVKKTYVIGIWPGRQAWIVNRKAADCVRNSTITGTDIGNMNSHSSLTALTYIMAPIEVPVYCSSIQVWENQIGYARGGGVPLEWFVKVSHFSMWTNNERLWFCESLASWNFVKHAYFVIPEHSSTSCDITLIYVHRHCFYLSIF